MVLSPIRNSQFATRSPSLRVTELRLTHFRNYEQAELATDGSIIVLTGANGSGKTNLLEALSLLTPGRGLRRANLVDVCNSLGPGTWAVAARLDRNGDQLAIGTGISAAQQGEGIELAQRKVRINAADAKPGELADHVSALWLTPESDGLFRGPAGDRRRFLDRLILALDPAHGARVNALDKLLRSRNRLLSEPQWDDKWLTAIEHELAEAAISVSAARLSQVESLAASITAHQSIASPFPFALLSMSGEIEDSLRVHSSVIAEDRYRDILSQTRGIDAAAGRTTRGSHLSDLSVVHGPKNIAAGQASTGEQKALLVGLILAQARHVAETRGLAPLLLLDEIAAHLDSIRRASLYDELEKLSAQAWLTGTDLEMFATLSGRASFVEVTNGMLRVAA
jgi:DNA replication and repair protein RecF